MTCFPVFRIALQLSPQQCETFETNGENVDAIGGEYQRP